MDVNETIGIRIKLPEQVEEWWYFKVSLVLIFANVKVFWEPRNTHHQICKMSVCIRFSKNTSSQKINCCHHAEKFMLTFTLTTCSTNDSGKSAIVGKVSQLHIIFLSFLCYAYHFYVQQAICKTPGRNINGRELFKSGGFPLQLSTKETRKTASYPLYATDSLKHPLSGFNQRNSKTVRQFTPPWTTLPSAEAFYDPMYRIRYKLKMH